MKLTSAVSPDQRWFWLDDKDGLQPGDRLVISPGSSNAELVEVADPGLDGADQAVVVDRLSTTPQEWSAGTPLERPVVVESRYRFKCQFPDCGGAATSNRSTDAPECGQVTTNTERFENGNWTRWEFYTNHGPMVLAGELVNVFDDLDEEVPSGGFDSGELASVHELREGDAGARLADAAEVGVAVRVLSGGDGCDPED